MGGFVSKHVNLLYILRDLINLVAVIELSDNRKKVNTTIINHTKRANKSNKKISNQKGKLINMANTQSYLHMTNSEMDTLIGPDLLALKNVRTKGGRLVSGVKVGIARELILQLQNPDHDAFKNALSEGVAARIRTGKTEEEKAVTALEEADAKDVVSKLSPKAKAALLKALN
jgi:hypothetical protein